MTMTIKVRGKSQKGKNRVRERGEVWRLVKTAESVLFSSERGPWLLLESLDGKSMRWMQAKNDDDFEQVEG